MPTFEWTKPIFLGAIVFYFLSSFSSCKEDEDKGPLIVTHSLVKSIRIDRNPYEYSETKFIYDTNFEKIIRVEETSCGSPNGTITFDYSTPGKLKLIDPVSGYAFKVFEINDMGLITKEFLDYDFYEWYAYAYDTNGYLTKNSYLSLPYGILLFENLIKDGNIIKQIQFDFGEVNRIKEFTYTNIENVNNIDPECFYRPNYLVPVKFYGKPSKKLVDYIEYWDPRSSSPKTKISFSYEFDNKNRVYKIIRTECDKHTYTYTYFE